MTDATGTRAAMRTYDADLLRREIRQWWPERHRRQYIRASIRFNLHSIRRMEATRS